MGEGITMSTNNPIKITITPLRPTNKGTPYAAFLGNRQIVERSHAPSFAACRWLVEQGFSGPAEIWRPGEQYPRMRIASIELAAKFTVRESEAHGPRVVPFKAFDGSSFQQQGAAR